VFERNVFVTFKFDVVLTVHRRQYVEIKCQQRFLFSIETYGKSCFG